jgi:hypothetical protein
MTTRRTAAALESSVSIRRSQRRNWRTRYRSTVLVVAPALSRESNATNMSYEAFSYRRRSEMGRQLRSRGAG